MFDFSPDDEDRMFLSKIGYTNLFHKVQTPNKRIVMNSNEFHIYFKYNCPFLPFVVLHVVIIFAKRRPYKACKIVKSVKRVSYLTTLVLFWGTLGHSPGFCVVASLGTTS